MVKIGKIKLKNPVLVASGTFGYAREFKDFLNLKTLGAIVTKTITLEPRSGNPMPRICETASGILNSIGLQNEGVENFIDEKLPYLSEIGTPIIVSISGGTIEEFRRLAKKLDGQRGVDGLELNISCPNVKAGKLESWKAGRLIAQDKDAVYRLVKAVRNITDKTLITKLSPNVTCVVEIAQAACRAGTDAVSLVNTFFGMAIDIDTKKPKLGSIIGGLSGPCIKPIALRMVWEVARSIEKPVIGIGGIMNYSDAIEFMIAGASAIQVGTSNFVQPDISVKIIKGIEGYLRKNRIDNINKLTGSLDDKG